MSQKIAVIGAGIAGLTVAIKLQNQGFKVEIFDKGRSVGGRMSSRRTPWGYIDHGAQYITIKSQQFSNFIDGYLPQGILAPWERTFAIWEDNQFVEENLLKLRYVPLVSMSNFGKQLAQQLIVKPKLNTKIISLERSQNWILRDSDNNQYGNYDFIILTAPPRQSADLLANHSPLSREVAQIEMLSCFSNLVGNHPLLIFD